MRVRGVMVRGGRVYRLIALAGFAGCVLSASPASAMDAEERLQFANGLYRRAMYELAIPEYRALLTNDAAAAMHDLAAFRIAESYRALERRDEAAAAYEQVVTVYTNSALVHRAAYRRAELDWLNGRLFDASRRFAALLETKPPKEIEAASLYFLGASLAGLDRFDDAEAPLRRMLRGHARSPYADYARLALADVLEKKGGSPADVAELLEAVIKNPETPALGAEALAKAGLLAYRQPDMATAAKHFAALMKAYPDDPWVGRVRLEAGWAMLFEQRWDEARQLAEAGLGAAGGDARAPWWYLLANIERRQSRAAEAMTWYETLLKEAPGHPLSGAAAYEACVQAFQDNQHARVLALAEKAKNGIEPERRPVLLWMHASALRAEGRAGEAESLYDALVRDHGETEYAASAAYQKALLLDERGDRAAAAKAFGEVAARYPGAAISADAWMAAGNTAMRNGSVADAVWAWTSLVQVRPDYPAIDEVRMGLARAYIELGQGADAAEQLRVLVAVHTNSRFMAEACYMLGSLYEKEERLAEAEEQYRLAGGHRPAEKLARQIQYRRVAVLQRQGRAPDAAGLMNDMLASDADAALPSALVEWLARWNLEQGDHARAELAGRRLLTTGDTPAWRHLGAYIAGMAALRQDRADAVEEAFAAAAGFGLATRETADAWYQRGLLALNRNEPAAALAHFEQAAAAASDDALTDIRARCYVQRGVAHEALEQWPEAARYYLGAAVLFDDPAVTPESLYRAAGVLEKQRQVVERDRVVAELAERYPESEWNRKAGERWRAPAVEAPVVP